MNTTHPIDANRSTASGIHRGIWVGGGLMALTIIALATTLVVRSNGSSDDNVAPQAAVDAAAITAAGPTAATNSSVAQQPPVVVAQQPVVQEAPRAVHRAPIHHEAENRNVQDDPQRVASVPVCATCGVIDGYSAVQVQGQSNGVGAVAGGLGGALLGSKIAGRGNHTLGGAIGAIGGGLLGNAVEKHERTVTVYDVRVRMNDGSLRTVRQASVPHVGERVNVEGNTLRVAPEAQG